VGVSVELSAAMTAFASRSRLPAPRSEQQLPCWRRPAWANLRAL